MRKSKNRYFYHIFVSPGDAPGAITLNVVWMEREFDAYKFSRSMYLYLQQFPSYSNFELQVQNNRRFHVPQPTFCFSWRRPCDYHVICSMNGKTIQCLPNPSQHVLPSIVSELYRYIRCLSPVAVILWGSWPSHFLSVWGSNWIRTPPLFYRHACYIACNAKCQCWLQ